VALERDGFEVIAVAGLMDALSEKRLKKGDLVLLVAVGAGYTLGSVLLRWAY